MKLTAENVHNLVKECLFEKEPVNPVIVEGIMSKFGFDPVKLKQHENEILDLLKELPDSFMKSKGGGWSFLNACMDKHGEHWGEHPDMEVLFCLGMAIEKVTSPLPREMWNVMPGGMPYYTVIDN